MGRRHLATVGIMWLVVAGCGDAGSPGPSNSELLLLVTVDTLRADHLGAYGSELGLTPNLDTLAEQSLVFESAYAPAPFTVPSLVALHTGRHPLELGLKTNLSMLPQNVTTLSEAFAERGFRTAAVVSNGVLRERTDIARGFELYDDSQPQSEAVRQMPERTASHTTDAALRVVDTWQSDREVNRQPLFLWVHFQDPHGPYTPPEGWRARYLEHERSLGGERHLPLSDSSQGDGAIPKYQYLDGEDEVAFYRAGYDAEIAFMDQELGRLLDALRERGLPSRIIFAADHGEALGEGDLWFAHGNDLTDALVRVPFFLQLPGLQPGRRRDVASLLDLVPTLLEERFRETLPDVVGRDLLGRDAEKTDSVAVFSTLGANPLPRLGIVADGYKLIITLRHGVWVPRLYRRGHEDVDLAAPAPQLATRLRDRLWAIRDRYDTGFVAPQYEVGEPMRQRLEALGYLDHESNP